MHNPIQTNNFHIIHKAKRPPKLLIEATVNTTQLTYIRMKKNYLTFTCREKNSVLKQKHNIPKKMKKLGKITEIHQI